MKSLLVAVVVALVVLPIGLLAQDAPKKVDVSGAWELNVESPQGAMTLTADYKQEGEKLTGTQASPMGENKLEGTVKGDQVHYTIKIDMNGQEMVITFDGKVDGDAISGQFDFGGMGQAPWTAKRKK
jgi:D-glucosaminate-6-phosphate ammonia-lyase